MGNESNLDIAYSVYDDYMGKYYNYKTFISNKTSSN